MKIVLSLTVLILSKAFAIAVPVEPRDSGDEKWATVRGQIVFDGEKIPDPVATNARLPNEPQFVLPWIVNVNNKGVKNVFVWLGVDTKDRGIRMPAEKIHPDLRKVPANAFEIDIRGKQYFPSSIAMRTGQKLIFKNATLEACDFKYQSLLLAGNVLVPPGKEHVVADLKAETSALVVNSNIFPWMKSHARVFDHPYFALTDDDGRFEIRLAPVGKLRMWLWHPESGWRDGAKGKDGDPIEVKPRGMDVGPIKIRPLPDAR